MKKSLLLSVIFSAMLLGSVAFAATEAQMRACYEAHSHLMEKKVGTFTLIDCWRVHGYLMARS